MKVFVVLFVVFAAANSSLFDDNFLNNNDDAPDNQVHFVSVEKVSDFMEKNPELELEMMKMYSDYRGQIFYHLGERQRGDRLVGTVANHQRWPRAQNVALEVKYPARGVGALVTYLSVNVTQDTNLGRAYITRGGIHQRNITVVVEAYGTTFISYICNIFGL